MVYHFGAAPLEWGGYVKHGRDEEIAFGVDVTPFADANRGEAVGELVGVFEAGVDDGAALEVDVSIAMVFFDEGEAIVVAVGFGAVAAIFNPLFFDPLPAFAESFRRSLLQPWRLLL